MAETVLGKPRKIHFTALLEAIAITMCRHMPVRRFASKLQKDDMGLGRLLDRSIEAARTRAAFSNVTSFGVDETWFAKGHRYLTKFDDLDRAQVLFAFKGRASDTLR